MATVFPSQPQIDPSLKQRALDALAAKGNSIAYKDVVGIVDFRRASRDPRFYLVEMASGMTTSYHCAHGRGSDPTHSGYLERFSNEIGSEATSRGSFVTGDVYYGKYGRSLRLTGLDPDNYNADARAIVVHSARYAEDEQIARFGKLGRSEGCFALSQISLQYVLLKLGPGRLLYSDKV
ncbi:murein L,D-transpeptidase catalytic domain-containing protein [Allosphingosinicella indica]|uniref:L,D-transpeptidase catalytic domain n=1 Tax=Allosphingosinicella indica TaxID=941907 RepID=A0A1X7FZC8_9SPHN|nr:murein L,D-transpeptidase catalytic domain family protein [Allosphingosinicella indica]SMF61429.1 L,D-transpeptidase catalytic domain [Allosphingosinicella indica]